MPGRPGRRRRSCPSLPSMAPGPFDPPSEPPGGRLRAGAKGHPDETHLPSLQGPPRPHAWLPRPHEDAWRTCRDQRTSRQGSQAPGCLSCGAAPPPAESVLGRLTRSADFERALGSPACARSPHFAVHYLATPPATPRDKREAQELSTDGEQSCTQPVDESSDPVPGPGARLGVVVPKRHARRAVTRTLLKRQMRAAAERRGSSEARLPQGIWVVRLRAPFDRALFESATSEPLRRAARIELDSLLEGAHRRACGSAPTGAKRAR